MADQPLPLVAQKTVRRRRLQHYIRQIKHLIAERCPAMKTSRIGTIDALDKAIQLLRTAMPNSQNCGEKYSQNCGEKQFRWHEMAECSDDSTAMAMGSNGGIQLQPINERLLVTLRISFPDGAIVDIRRVREDLEAMRIGRCIFDFLADSGRHSLLGSVFGESERRRIFSRIQCGDRRKVCELLCEFDRDSNRVCNSAFIHVLDMASGWTARRCAPVTFTTKHSPVCSIQHIDPSSIAFLGHLPSELLGRSLFTIVHAQDVQIILNVHQLLVASKGRLVRTKPLRLLARNGAAIRVETEWSAYFNPWTRKLDTIFGRHSIGAEQSVAGDEVDIFAETAARPYTLQHQAILTHDAQVAAILSKPIKKSDYRASNNNNKNNTTNNNRQTSTVSTTAVTETRGQKTETETTNSSSNGSPLHHIESVPIVRGTDLGSYLDRIVETLVINSRFANHKNGGQLFNNNSNHRPSTSPEDMHGSGTIDTGSPPHSTNPTAIPLTYNQINCLENVHRLLSSQPRTERSADSTGSPSKVSPKTSNSPEADETSTTTTRRAFEMTTATVGVNGSVAGVGGGQQAMPLTRELLQQHTRKWEQEYRDNWKRRLALKRPAADGLLAPSSAKLFRTERPPSAHAPTRSEYFPPSRREDYYRSLGPNPPPPPGRNFQITSVPLPPRPPSDEQRRSAFVTVTQKAIRDLPQPINLSIADNNSSRSVIQSSLNQETKPRWETLDKVNQETKPRWEALDKVNQETKPRWEALDKDNCAARLISMAAARAQQQQSATVTITSSPVKEATEALMLLQETA